MPVTRRDGPRPGGRWLLLIHQLPKEPAYLRVKIGRRLERVGAIALKNSVYVLPQSDAAAEDFQWVRREIVAGGGEATVVEAQLVEGLSDAEAEARFRDAKDAQYAELARAARERLATVARRRRPADEPTRQALLAELTQLERRVEEIAATDFFGASGREVVAGLLRELRAKAAPQVVEGRQEPEPPTLRGRTWVTRAGVEVDRIASAWLIKRCIDPDARFKLVPAKGYARLDGEQRFDMFEAEHSHEGDACTFETLLARFDVREAGMRAVADVIHDIDLKESKFGRPETAGVAACLSGVCSVSRDDEERLLRGTAVLEALLGYFAAKKESRA